MQYIVLNSRMGLFSWTWIKLTTVLLPSMQKSINRREKWMLKKWRGFIGDLNLPRLLSDSVDVLEAHITLREIEAVVSAFPNNKVPGPDGFSMEFF